MKLFTIFFLLVCQFSFGQYSIETNFNSVYIGRNQSLLYKQHLKNFSIYGGIKFHFNKPELTGIGSFIKKGGFATSFPERLGIQLGMEYFIWNNNNFFIGVFYDNQLSLMYDLHKMKYAVGTLVPNPQTESDFVYIYEEKKIGRMFTTDNVIGICIKNRLFNEVFLTLKGGLGMLYFKNYDKKNIILAKNFNSGISFTSFFSVGLSYKFKKKVRKK